MRFLVSLKIKYILTGKEWQAVKPADEGSSTAAPASSPGAAAVGGYRGYGRGRSSPRSRPTRHIYIYLVNIKIYI